MKKIFLVIMLLATTAFAVTITHYNRSSTHAAVAYQLTYDKVTISDDDGDANDFSQHVDVSYAILERIVIDSNGTDTSYKIYVYDENSAAIFTKTDCTSASEPYTYALSSTDTATTTFLGVPVVGSFSVTMADGDDATMDDIHVTVYYREFIR